jgi:hypothetical protein
VATRTFYLDGDSTAPGGTSIFCTGSQTAPADATTATGWVLGTRTPPALHELFARQILQTSWGTTSSQQPGVPSNTKGNGFALGPFTGTFAAGTWDVALALLATAAGGAGDVAIRYRIYRADDALGTNAVELTAAPNQASTVTDLTTGTPQTSSGTVALSAATLTAQYLILTVSVTVIGAASGSTSNCVVRAGSASRLITPDFTGTAPGDVTSAPVRRRAAGLLCALGLA